jgi:hypothetical protein
VEYPRHPQTLRDIDRCLQPRLYLNILTGKVTQTPSQSSGMQSQGVGCSSRPLMFERKYAKVGVEFLSTVDRPQIGQVLKDVFAATDALPHIACGRDTGQVLVATGLPGSGGCPI